MTRVMKKFGEVTVKKLFFLEFDGGGRPEDHAQQNIFHFRPNF